MKFCFNLGFLNSKDLDPSYDKDLEFCDWKGKFPSYNRRNRVIISSLSLIKWHNPHLKK